MRLVGNALARELQWAPLPLEICPGRPIWEAHRGSEYLVFVDESFFRFFGFDAIDGNFCHAAVGVPTANYPRLKNLLEPIVEAYEKRVIKAGMDAPEEIKHSVLQRLDHPFRLRFSRELVGALVETGGFVSGFYTPTRGQVMERVRTNLVGDADEVPQQHTDLYNTAKQELLAEYQGTGQARLITSLLSMAFPGITRFIQSFECTFRLQYDPRQEDEDCEVRDAIAEYMDDMMRLPEPLGADDVYLGMEIGVKSHDELGLQLADVFAGEVRNFFRNDPDAGTLWTMPRLITGVSNEPLQQFETINNTLFKLGSLSPMSTALRRRLARRNGSNVVSYYYPVLAAGMLTCVTPNGQQRHLEIPTGMIFDVAD